MYKVVLATEFKDWLTSLSQDERESVLAALVVLQNYGHQLGRPHADTLKNSKLTNLKELRIQHAGKPYRAFYIFDPKRQAVMLCGGDKVILPNLRHLINRIKLPDLVFVSA
ncbi:type II toxin-antitoxin system RelE/ParE family toxin [Psychrobacter ciconiae]|uniref:type II toxin-antitoxin system RelE/ParE family toxin n=1 Tax=Psychrobacter ciconiae TaxID=1553449 RepID=UPI00191A3889|nr:type II toxin-antitoxin system RelE/ParE family toxin [Psychrobacter ciconiae]